MNTKRIAAVVGAALLGTAAIAYAQTVAVPMVGSINPGSDLVQIIPMGQPRGSNQYATVAQLLTGSTNASGLSGAGLPMTNFKASTGIGMTASATGGAFGVAITAGTSEHLIGEAANSNTKTDTAGFEIVLPANYVVGQNITVTVNCNYTVGSGTIGTHTLTAHAYPVASDGTQAADIITTAAQSVPSSAGTVSFVIPGTTLVANQRLWVTLVMVIQDTGGSNITGQINSVKLS